MDTNRQILMFGDQSSYVVQPEREGTVSLMQIILRKKRGIIQIPKFQRDFVWDKHPGKIANWAKTLLAGRAPGVIFTYQIIDDAGYVSAVYLGDGYQRVVATERIMEEPAVYGLDMSIDEIAQVVDNFSVTVQHWHYKTEKEAYQSFINLNIGTIVKTPELYKGLLTQIDGGLELRDRLTQIVTNTCYHLCGDVLSLKNNTPHKVRRDSMALFYQYATAHKKPGFWESGKMNGMHTKGPSIEQNIVDYIESTTASNIDAKVKAFAEYLSQITALITETWELIHDKRAMSYQVFSVFSHLAIYRKNTSAFTVEQYRSALQTIFPFVIGSAKIAYVLDGKPHPHGQLLMETDSLSRLLNLLESIGAIPIDGSRRSRRSKNRMGYDHSHVKPVSMFGEGETFHEPSLINRARGAKEVYPSP